MKTVGKVVDATVLVGSTVVGYGAIKAISMGLKTKSTGTILMGGITLLIGIYAFKESMRKLNEPETV